MKSIFSELLLGTAFILAPLNALSQGQVYVSNLAEPSSGGGNSFSKSMWLAQFFVTGTDPEGYDLNSVQLSLGVTGSPVGNVVVYLYGTYEDGPGAEVAEINYGAPSNSGTYTFNAPGRIILSPSTDYFIVVTTTAASSPYAWNSASDFNYTSSDNWSLPATTPWTSTNGSNWPVSVNGFIPSPYQMAVTATPTAKIAVSVSSGTLSLSWGSPGYTLQTQTNGLGTNWVSVPGSTSITGTNITINPSTHSEFFRLVQ